MIEEGLCLIVGTVTVRARTPFASVGRALLLPWVEGRVGVVTTQGLLVPAQPEGREGGVTTQGLLVPAQPLSLPSLLVLALPETEPWIRARQRRGKMARWVITARFQLFSACY